MSQLDARTLGAAVHAYFDTHTLAKGCVYQQQHRVQNCLVTLAEPRGWIIAADVRGSQPTPYGVEIQLSRGDGMPVIQGSCSCPMAGDCKHVAAVLLQRQTRAVRLRLSEICARTHLRRASGLVGLRPLDPAQTSG